MTPDQALAAASILQRHLPDTPSRLADVLAAIDHLNRLAAAPARWRVNGSTLHAADPGGFELRLARVPGFAEIAGRCLAQPNEWIDASGLTLGSASPTAGRRTVNAQRTALARRLGQRGLAELADAVRGIRLKSDGDGFVLACYEPQGRAIAIKLSLP